MKDNFFEMLLNLFEKTLSQLRKSHTAVLENGANQDNNLGDPTAAGGDGKVVFVKEATENSMRVFTEVEQIKLTKTSYQFLMRLGSLGVLSKEMLELVMNQLLFSESRFVGIQETKWTVRHLFSNRLTAEQLAFLDLLLYHKEDKLPLH